LHKAVRSIKAEGRTINSRCARARATLQGPIICASHVVGVSIAGPPANQTNCPGATASFNVSATGTGLEYQWYKASALLAGETGNSITITNVTAANAGSYSVVVSGTCSNPVTNSATLTVNENVVVATAPATRRGPKTY